MSILPGKSVHLSPPRSVGVKRDCSNPALQPGLAPTPEQVIEEQGREIERLQAELKTAQNNEQYDARDRQALMEEGDDLRAQLQTAEQERDEARERVALAESVVGKPQGPYGDSVHDYLDRLCIERFARIEALQSALQASQQEAERLRKAWRNEYLNFFGDGCLPDFERMLAALSAPSAPQVEQPRMITIGIETDPQTGERNVVVRGEQAADSKVDRTVKDSLTVAEYRCTRCNGLAEWDASQSVWRHMSGDPLSNRLLEQSFCDKYGYPIDVRVAATPAVEQPDTVEMERLRSQIQKIWADARLRAPHESYCESLKHAYVSMEMCSCWLKAFVELCSPSAPTAENPDTMRLNWLESAKALIEACPDDYGGFGAWVVNGAAPHAELRAAIDAARNAGKEPHE